MGNAPRYIAWVVMLTASACWLPLETGRQMQADIAVLQTELTEAKRDVSEQRTKLDEKLQEVTTALQELNRASRMTDADFGVQIERLIKEVQELRGQGELVEHRLSKAEQALQGVTTKTETAKPADASPNKDEAGVEDAMPKDKNEALAYAQKLEKQGNINEARGAFRQVIKQWPKDAGIADAAYYRLGESYFQEKRYRNAMQEYAKIVEQFGSGKFADEAYYRIGQCSLELGNLEDAEIFFNEVVTHFKKSPHFKDANSKLSDVRKRLAQEKKGKKK